MNLKLNNGSWLNQPKQFQVNQNSISLVTEPKTDFWQRSYYGFRNDNAPAYLFESSEQITLRQKLIFNIKIYSIRRVYWFIWIVKIGLRRQSNMKIMILPDWAAW